jgi:hypothetical protein
MSPKALLPPGGIGSLIAPPGNSCVGLVPDLGLSREGKEVRRDYDVALSGPAWSDTCGSRP